MRPRILPPLVLALGSLLASPASLAQTQVRREPSAAELALAKDMLKEAAAEVKAGKCEDAVSMLKQVVAIKETGEALMLLGDCQAKKEPVEALETYRRAEELARKERDKATEKAVATRIADLSGKLPTVLIQLPEGVSATVTLDGKEIPADQLGQPIPVTPGEHTIEAKAEGKSPFTKTIEANEKENVVRVELGGGAGDSTGGGGGAGGDTGEQPRQSTEIPLATWIAGSAAIVLLAGGVVAFVAAGSAASDGEKECKTLAKCDEDAIDSVRQLDAAALGLWIGAAVGAGVAITFYVLETGKTKASVTAAPYGPRRAPPVSRAQSGRGTALPIPTSSRGAALPIPTSSRGAALPIPTRVSVGPGSVTIAGSF